MDNFNVSDAKASKIVTEAEIRKSGGIIYDPEAFAGESGPASLPDVDEMLSAIESVLEYMCTDEMIQLKSDNMVDFSLHMEEKFPVLAEKHFSMFQLILGGEDLTYLFNMLEKIDRVNKGQSTMDDIEKELGSQLQEDFVKTVDEEDEENDEDDDIDIDISDEESVVTNTKKRKKKRKRNRKKVISIDAIDNTHNIFDTTTLCLMNNV